MFTSGYLCFPNKVVVSVLSPAKGIRKNLIVEAVKAQDLENAYQRYCLRGAKDLTWVWLRYEPLVQRTDAKKLLAKEESKDEPHRATKSTRIIVIIINGCAGGSSAGAAA